MSSLGILGKEHIFFQEYFDKRTQYIEIEGKQTEMEQIDTGVPQGASLASTLFLIYINDIDSSNFNGNTTLYADDMGIITIAETMTELQK